MRSDELIRSVVLRTGIPHDEVRIILDTIRQIIKEQLAVHEHVILPRMFRIGAHHTPQHGWKPHVSVFKELKNAVGSEIREL